jgi:Holliday junction resolvasome RuvABC endonuclease subunit
MILGLDISTSCTGWCIIDASGKLIGMGSISLSKDKSIFKKAQKVKRELSRLNIEYDIEKVCVEENLQAFRPGLSSAKTLLTLARFNGIVSYLAQEEFYFAPVFINVNSARKALGIKIKRKKDGGKPTKEQIVEWASGELNNFTWPTKILKSGPRKNQVILDPSSYDMADAYVISRAGLMI